MDRRILTKHKQALQKAERVNILQYPGVCQLFVLACIVTDAFTLYTIFDIMLKQRPSLTLVITVMVATVLNITPMIAAVCINNQEYTKQKKMAVCTILGILFITFFGATFALRMASQESFYDASSEEISVGNEEFEQSDEEKFEPTLAQTILAGLMGLEPLGTSVCTFVLSLEVSQEAKKKRKRELERIKLEKELDECKIMRDELLADMDFDLNEYDREQLKKIAALILKQGEFARVYSIRKLCENDGTPEGISELLESKSEIQNQDEQEADVIDLELEPKTDEEPQARKTVA